ncbi:alpha/beta hydrolase [Patescibacteria group bacterium]|nr:alpha/beta hydrolase [Patescibacteria group bacterium]
MDIRQQILHIHGGSAFNSYDNYIRNLKKWNISIDDESQSKHWSRNYYSFLFEDSFQCIVPTMPSKHNAKYLEWKIWFEKYLSVLHNDVILVGHSLGGTFLAKYLSEESFPVSIKQLHLVAPVYDYEDDEEELADFRLADFPGKLLDIHISEIHIYTSKDDDIVPYTESEKYHKQIPGSSLHIFEDRGHFLGEEFSELFENIKKVSS